jgi:hypothetical protein
MKSIKREVSNRIERYIEWYNEYDQLHREDGPAVEYPYGTYEWWFDGKRHREGGPAVEWADGDKEWYVNGQLHREGGPAMEWAGKYKAWWIKGRRISIHCWTIILNANEKYTEPDHTLVYVPIR